MDFERFLRDDSRSKARCRGGLAVGKKRPGSLILPSMLKGKSREPPYSWLTAEPIVKVIIPTGEVLVFRWPVE